ncbi:MAG: RsmB/NOP family class I SAM-dependent RNA methyltransferase [Alphaproteobacteria bacterium]
MTPAARIQAVIELLAEVVETPRPADTVASLYFRARRYIGSSDRGAINTRFYRAMREYIRLSWWVEKCGAETTPRNLIIAALIFDREHTAESLPMMFSGARYAPEELTEAEYKLAQALEGKKLDDAEMPLRERCECPDWAFDALQSALGPRFEAELKAMLSPAPLDLRVNTIKATRDDVLKRLKQEGFDAEAGKISPLSIRVLGRPQLSQHELYLQGHFEIQDEGSQMVALVAAAQPGEQVADFCAGAGGKTLALGASMDNKGRIVAMDVLGGRLERAKERFRRAGLHNIETRSLTSERDKYVKRAAGKFDLVLVDAPCSGVGTWRRDPDKRWRQLGPGLSSLVPLQKDILDSAHRLVRPGGRLVYATCSLLPEENELQIETFLAAHPDFSIDPVSARVKVEGAGDFLHMTPARHDTDGFFAAVLRRKEQVSESKQEAASDKEAEQAAT